MANESYCYICIVWVSGGLKSGVVSCKPFRVWQDEQCPSDFCQMGQYTAQHLTGSNNSLDLYSHKVTLYGSVSHCLGSSQATVFLCERAIKLKRKMYRGTNKDRTSETTCSKTQPARWGVTEEGGVGCESVEVEEKQREKREKSWWKRLRVLLWTALIVNMKEGNRTPLDTWRQEVSAHPRPLSVSLPPAHTQMDKLSSNCLLLQLSDLITFHQVAFCSASVNYATHTFFSPLCFFFSRPPFFPPTLPQALLFNGWLFQVHISARQ